MFRFVTIYLLIILVIPHIRTQNMAEETATAEGTATAEETNTTDTQLTNSTVSPVWFDSSTESITGTATISEEPTAVTPSSTDVTETDATSIDSTTAEPLSSGSSDETTEQISTTATTPVTTKPSTIQFFYCDFNTSLCFENSTLNVTTGSEFNPVPLSPDTPPPRAPTSDVSSITEPTDNGEECILPYRPEFNDNNEITKWNMSFCYNEQCPTENGTANCTSDYYGLISLEASETNVTISESVSSPTNLPNSVVKQLLEFYYYFTVYEEQPNWDQQIQVWLKPNNENDNKLSLVNLTINDMTGNKWQYRNVSFESPSENYILDFVFKAEDGIPELNETIYFALDNIALYYIDNPYTDETSTDSQSSITPSATTITPPVTTTTPPATPNITSEKVNPSTTTTAGSALAETIGISVGVVVPVLLIVIGGTILYKKKKKGTHTYDIPLTSTHHRRGSDVFDNPLLF